MNYTDKDIKILANHFNMKEEKLKNELSFENITIHQDTLSLAMFLWTPDEDGNVESLLSSLEKLLVITSNDLPGDEKDWILERLVLNEGGVKLENGQWAFTYHYQGLT